MTAGPVSASTPRLARSERGRGPPVLLVHGFTGSTEAWPPQCVDALAARHRVLIVDLPGHGSSPDRECTFSGTVEALVAVLDDAGVAAATWIGYSMGARLALASAVRFPDRVGRLVLESGSPGLETVGERVRRTEDDESLARRIERDGVPSFVEWWMSRPLFASQRALPPEVLARERGRRLRCRSRGLAASLRGAGTGAQPSYWKALGEIRMPTLLLTGGLDPKFTRLAGRMALALPRASHVAVPHAGHAVHLERSDPWIRTVLDFLV